MFTKSYTFIPYRLQDHKVQKWKKGFFPCTQGVQQSFGGSKNHFFRVDMDEGLQILVSRLIRYM
jgi:hypothetical protein